MKNHLAGFNDSVKPFKDNALFWFNVWVSLGKPRNCTLHNIMKTTKNTYNKNFKQYQKNQNIIKKNKLLNACLNGDGNIFDEIKSLRNTKKRTAKSIDGVSKNIPNHFRGIYKELYNRVNDEKDVDNIDNEIRDKITSNDINEVDKVNSNVVLKAIKKVKAGKGDPLYKFSSDCFKIESLILTEYLTAKFKSLSIHAKNSFLYHLGQKYLSITFIT